MMKVMTVLMVLGALAGTGRAGAESFPLGRDDVVGTQRMVHTSAEDTLLDIAHRHGFGYREIRIANPGVDPWLPGEGTAVVLPGEHVLPHANRQGIVINIPEMRLYHYPAYRIGETPQVMVYPIGIGKLGWRIPETLTYVAGKLENPTWRVPESIKSERAAEDEILPDEIPPGPGNPLGEYALTLGLSRYLIHGTNKKYGIGMRVSHGCIRLAPDDIRDLFLNVPVGTPVRIVNQPYKAGWRDGRLYLEAHPPLEEASRDAGVTEMVAAIIRATGNTPYVIDWEAAARVIDQAQGIPLPIGGRGNP